MEYGAIIDVIRLIGVAPESDLAAAKLLLVDDRGRERT